MTFFQDSLTHTVPDVLGRPSDVGERLHLPGDAANLAAILAGDPVAAAGTTDPTGLTADLSTLLGEPGWHRGHRYAESAVTDLSTQFALGLWHAIRRGVRHTDTEHVLSFSAPEDALGSPAQRWGSDCYVRPDGRGIADAEGITAASAAHTRRHDASHIRSLSTLGRVRRLFRKPRRYSGVWGFWP